MAFYKINDVNIYYEVSGDLNSKTAVVFLNGVMASTNSWNYLSPTFEETGLMVIRHDFRGQLKSDKPKGPYTFSLHAEDAKKLFEELGVEKVHIIGTSYGGEVAMKFAIMYPEMTKSISVIDSVSELDEVLKGFIDGWIVLCDAMDGEKFFRGMAPSIYGNSFYTNNKKMLEERAKDFKRMPKEYFEGQKILYETFKKDVYMTNELKNIKCPALIIVGQDDLLKRVKFSDILAREIPNSEYIIIPDCGHVSIFEKYKELNSMLYGFIFKNSK
ncbi:alpha/beta fold hydrolase [Clostridium sp. MB05]|uniref:alpha/beta fold hydrolase n=1 Tax=Clostridium sp. MB05 TaxID=3376682 RepID=UPI00398226D3